MNYVEANLASPLESEVQRRVREKMVIYSNCELALLRFTCHHEFSRGTQYGGGTRGHLWVNCALYFFLTFCTNAGRVQRMRCQEAIAALKTLVREANICQMEQLGQVIEQHAANEAILLQACCHSTFNL